MNEEIKNSVRKVINEIPVEFRIGSLLAIGEVVLEEIPKACEAFEERKIDIINRLVEVLRKNDDV